MRLRCTHAVLHCRWAGPTLCIWPRVDTSTLSTLTPACVPRTASAPHRTFGSTPRHGIYIDDMCMLALRSQLDTLTDLLDEYLEVMPGQKLPPESSKTTRPSADGVVCIGMEIHGRHMTVGPEPQKVKHLIKRTRTLLRQCRYSGLLMSKISGHWSWYFLCLLYTSPSPRDRG